VIDFANDAPDGTGYVTVGHRFPTANHREAIDANTIEGVQDIPPERRARANWRSTVFAPFQVGPTRYFLAFYSLEPMPGPFTAFDTSFIETIASLCSSRLQQRAQFERIRYQTEHDALTAILSRTRFRASGFAAMRASKGEWLCQLGYPG
jgi:GAF domain-containing protein